MIREKELQVQKEREASKPPDKWDVLIQRLKNHRFWIVRAVFYFVYSIWFVLFTIISFLISLIALGPG